MLVTKYTDILTFKFAHIITPKWIYKSDDSYELNFFFSFCAFWSDLFLNKCLYSADKVLIYTSILSFLEYRIYHF